MNPQLLVCSHAMILNAKEGRALEAEGRQIFEKSKGKKMIVLTIICREKFYVFHPTIHVTSYLLVVGNRQSESMNTVRRLSMTAPQPMLVSFL